MPARRRCALIVVLASLIAVACAAPAVAGPDAKAEIVPLGMTVDHAPHAVLGADGRRHLAYEITIVNQTPGDVTLRSVQALAGKRAIGARLEGDSLAALLRVNGGEGPVIPGGGSALLFMDVAYPAGAPRPRRLAHALTMTLSQPPEPEQRFSFVGVPTRVASRPRDPDRRAAARSALGRRERVL